MCAIASLEIEMRPSGVEMSTAGSTAVRGAGLRRAGLDGLLDLAGLEALRADVGPLGLALQQHADALEVRVEAPLGRHHRVAPVVAEARLLPADCADLGHSGAGW